MRYVIDIDGVLCENGSPETFPSAIPKHNSIEQVNKLFSEGNYIVLWTARKEDDRPVTERWLTTQGVRYHELHFGKQTADVYVDDKAIAALPTVGATLNRRELVVCLSGGMDSYIAYHYALAIGYAREDVLCVYFDLGHPYAAKEQRVLRTLDIPYTTIPVGMVHPSFGNVPDINNYIIPGRNLVFASIGAALGRRVWIMGMKYENHYLMFDKNDSFFRIASLAATQATGSSTIVESPFIDMTKTDIINWALRFELPHLHDTTSCYHPNFLRCGECSLCFKRYIAMLACGEEEEFNSDPSQSFECKRLVQVYKQALASNDFSHYQKERVLETLTLLGEI